MTSWPHQRDDPEPRNPQIASDDAKLGLHTVHAADYFAFNVIGIVALELTARLQTSSNNGLGRTLDLL